MPGLEDRINDSITHMPALSPTVSKVIETANNLASSPRDMVKVIKMDPVLTAKVQKLINSSFFGMAQEITSVDRAVILLGINTVKNLALSTAVIAAMDQGPRTSVDMDGIWSHSLAVGVAAKLIAKRQGVDPKQLDEYFIGGLVHDIGTILIMQYMPKEYTSMVQKLGGDQSGVLVEEQESLGMTHTGIGALIAQKWKLSDNVRAAIQQHHDPDQIGEHVQFVNVINLADWSAQHHGFTFAGDQLIPEADFMVLDTMGMSEQDVLAATADLKDQVEKASIFLKTARS